jgi:hypothetical protein
VLLARLLPFGGRHRAIVIKVLRIEPGQRLRFELLQRD